MRTLRILGLSFKLLVASVLLGFPFTATATAQEESAFQKELKDRNLGAELTLGDFASVNEALFKDPSISPFLQLKISAPQKVHLDGPSGGLIALRGRVVIGPEIAATVTITDGNQGEFLIAIVPDRSNLHIGEFIDYAEPVRSIVNRLPFGRANLLFASKPDAYARGTIAPTAGDLRKLGLHFSVVGDDQLVFLDPGFNFVNDVDLAQWGVVGYGFRHLGVKNLPVVLSGRISVPEFGANLVQRKLSVEIDLSLRATLPVLPLAPPNNNLGINATEVGTFYFTVSPKFGLSIKKDPDIEAEGDLTIGMRQAVMFTMGAHTYGASLSMSYKASLAGAEGMKVLVRFQHPLDGVLSAEWLRLDEAIFGFSAVTDAPPTVVLGGSFFLEPDKRAKGKHLRVVGEFPPGPPVPTTLFMSLQGADGNRQPTLGMEDVVLLVDRIAEAAGLGRIQMAAEEIARLPFLTIGPASGKDFVEMEYSLPEKMLVMTGALDFGRVRIADVRQLAIRAAVGPAFGFIAEGRVGGLGLSWLHTPELDAEIEILLRDIKHAKLKMKASNGEFFGTKSEIEAEMDRHDFVIKTDSNLFGLFNARATFSGSPDPSKPFSFFAEIDDTDWLDRLGKALSTGIQDVTAYTKTALSHTEEAIHFLKSNLRDLGYQLANAERTAEEAMREVNDKLNLALSRAGSIKSAAEDADSDCSWRRPWKCFEAAGLWTAYGVAEAVVNSAREAVEAVKMAERGAIALEKGIENAVAKARDELSRHTGVLEEIKGFAAHEIGFIKQGLDDLFQLERAWLVADNIEIAHASGAFQLGVAFKIAGHEYIESFAFNPLRSKDEAFKIAPKKEKVSPATPNLPAGQIMPSGGEPAPLSSNAEFYAMGLGVIRAHGPAVSSTFARLSTCSAFPFYKAVALERATRRLQELVDERGRAQWTCVSEGFDPAYCGKWSNVDGLRPYSGGMITSVRSSASAIRFYGDQPRLSFNSCSMDNPDCTWMIRPDGRITSNRDPSLALRHKPWDGWLDFQRCSENDPTCKWVITRDGKILSPSNPYGWLRSGNLPVDQPQGPFHPRGPFVDRHVVFFDGSLLRVAQEECRPDTPTNCQWHINSMPSRHPLDPQRLPPPSSLSREQAERLDFLNNRAGIPRLQAYVNDLQADANTVCDKLAGTSHAEPPPKSDAGSAKQVSIMHSNAITRRVLQMQPQRSQVQQTSARSPSALDDVISLR